MKIDELILELENAKEKISPDSEVKFYVTSSDEDGREGIKVFEINLTVVSESEETFFLIGTER